MADWWECQENLTDDEILAKAREFFGPIDPRPATPPLEVDSSEALTTPEPVDDSEAFAPDPIDNIEQPPMNDSSESWYPDLDDPMMRDDIHFDYRPSTRYTAEEEERAYKEAHRKLIDFFAYTPDIDEDI